MFVLFIKKLVRIAYCGKTCICFADLHLDIFYFTKKSEVYVFLLQLDILNVQFTASDFDVPFNGTIGEMIFC